MNSHHQRRGHLRCKNQKQYILYMPLSAFINSHAKKMIFRKVLLKIQCQIRYNRKYCLILNKWTKRTPSSVAKHAVFCCLSFKFNMKSLPTNIKGSFRFEHKFDIEHESLEFQVSHVPQTLNFSCCWTTEHWGGRGGGGSIPPYIWL